MQSPEDAARVVAIVAHYDGAKLGARDRGPCRQGRSRLREAEVHGSLGQIPTAQFVLVIGTVLGTIALRFSRPSWRQPRSVALPGSADGYHRCDAVGLSAVDKLRPSHHARGIVRTSCCTSSACPRCGLPGGEYG